MKKFKIWENKVGCECVLEVYAILAQVLWGWELQNSTQANWRNTFNWKFTGRRLEYLGEISHSTTCGKESRNLFPTFSLCTSAHLPLLGRDYLFIASTCTSNKNITLENVLRSHLLGSWISRCCPCLWIPTPDSWGIDSCWPTWVWFSCQNLTLVNETNGVEKRGKGKWQLTEIRCHWKLGRYPKSVQYTF